MKILESSILFEEFDTEEEKEIIELVKKSKPSTNSKLSVAEITENAGWIYITAKINDSEISINHSSYVSDSSYLIEFFEKIIHLKEELVLVLDYEGSNPILYAAPIDENNVRFLFAHDYNLFLNDDIDEYKISDYTIECDIIIDKKELLENFYKILYPFTVNYNIKEAREGHYDDVFNLEKGKKYLKTIKEYLDNVKEKE